MPGVWVSAPLIDWRLAEALECQAKKQPDAYSVKPIQARWLGKQATSGRLN